MESILFEGRKMKKLLYIVTFLIVLTYILLKVYNFFVDIKKEYATLRGDEI